MPMRELDARREGRHLKGATATSRTAAVSAASNVWDMSKCERGKIIGICVRACVREGQNEQLATLRCVQDDIMVCLFWATAEDVLHLSAGCGACVKVDMHATRHKRCELCLCQTCAF